MKQTTRNIKFGIQRNSDGSTIPVVIVEHGATHRAYAAGRVQ